MSSAPIERLFGYRVFVPPRNTGQEAQQLARRLEQNGFDDLLLYRSGEFANGISLGVFSQRANAERQAGRARQAGVDIELVALTRPEQARFVDVQRPADVAIDIAPVEAALGTGSLSSQALDCSLATVE